MLDHSAVSILPFLLTFFSFLIVILPLLLIWLPDGATEAPCCPACQAEKDQIRYEHREPTLARHSRVDLRSDHAIWPPPIHYRAAWR
jgi:hypothetical protein